jgi:tetratricopeptide (TPR) repeat protein
MICPKDGALRGDVMADKIFINYRREDSIGTAGRLHDRLAQTFGRDNLFMDVDHIPAGVDFVEYLNSQVAACDVFLAIIGPNWLNVKDKRGRRRFDNPDDFATIEIAAALARDIRVIPVLVDGARMPNAERLPDSVKPLVRRNAVEIRNTQFGRDAEALANKVREALPRPVRRQLPFLATAAAWLAPGHWRTVAGSATALALVGWVGLYQVGVPVWVPWTSGTDQLDHPPRADRDETAADAEAKRKAEEAEQAEKERLAAAKAEEERKAKAAADAEAQRKREEAEQQRLAAAKAEEERKAKAAAEAEARARAEQAEKERLAAAKAEEERKAKAAADAEAQRKREEAERLTALTPAEQERYDRAIAGYGEAIRLDPKNAAAFHNRGLVHFWIKGDSDRAIADYSAAIRLNPKYIQALINRGVAYWMKGDSDRAIADYSAAIQHDPNNAVAFCYRGKARLKINEVGGNADIAKAKELDSSSCQ